MSQSRMEHYQAYLERMGYRMTPERKLAAEIILSLDGPYMNEAVYDEVVKRSAERSISRATVYRVLHQLQEAGLIRLND